MSQSTTTTYTFNNVNIRDVAQLRIFLLSYAQIKQTPIYNVFFDDTNHILTVQTTESEPSTITNDLINDTIRNKYPDPPFDNTNKVESSLSNVLVSKSVYGYFPQSTSIDGNAVITANTSLTRNMYYSNLTINPGITLNTNGWRVVVTETLTLEGTISNNGNDASGLIAGTGSAPIFTTYLGSGTSGGEGITKNGNGISGVSATYQCSGGAGGDGGHGSGSSTGGSGGSLMQIDPVDGGLNTLSTMPTAFLGRMISNNFYVMGGTGGGGGGCTKGNASTVRSGAGGGGGGFMIIAAKNIVGSGQLQAKGGDGSSATWSGTGTQSPNGIGGGGGGGGGCVIVITQGLYPDTIYINVSGGKGGSGVAPGSSGMNGSDGNAFVLSV